MDKLTIEVKAPEIAEAVKTLAESLSRFAEVYRAAQQVQPVQQPIQPVQQQAQPVQQQEQPQPQQQFTLHNPVTNAPYDPQPQAQQVAQQVAQQPPAPTTAPTYTMEQLAVAATQLMDAGQKEVVLGLLAAFGVEALTQLPHEQYGVFATALRGKGAKI